MIGVSRPHCNSQCCLSKCCSCSHLHQSLCIDTACVYSAVHTQHLPFKLQHIFLHCSLYLVIMAEYPLPRDIAEHVPAELQEFILSVDPLEPENTRLAAAYVLLQNGITTKAALMDFEVSDCRKGECGHVVPKPSTVLQLRVSMQALCQRAEYAASSGAPYVKL